MAGLSKSLDAIVPLLQGDAVYLDYPVHGNIGDLLIWKGARALLRRHRRKLLGEYSKDNLGVLARNNIERCKTICFHGGGNLGDLWPLHQSLREGLIQDYPNKRIIIFPQSVHYENSASLEKSCRILRRHPDLHIFVRDKSSFTTLTSQGLPNVRLSPDTAHALWGTISVPKPIVSEPLYLFRRDKEQGPLPFELLGRAVKSLDWADGYGRGGWRAFDFGLKVNSNDARFGNRLPATLVWSLVSGFLIHRAVGLFGPYRTIITNRLHATILGALLERRVIVYDNSYGKLSSYIDCWLRDVPGIDLHAA